MFGKRSFHFFTILLLILTSWTSFSGEIENISFENKVKVGGKELLLNGMGLRKVYKFGIPIKVYVAGLYAEKPIESLKEALSLEGPIRVHMVFLRRVDKDKLQEAWKDGIRANCNSKDCGVAREQVMKFNLKMVDSKDKKPLVLDFYKDRVEMNFEGRESVKESFSSPEFARSLLAVFIGAKPPTADLKEGLLSTKTSKK